MSSTPRKLPKRGAPREQMVLGACDACGSPRTVMPCSNADCDAWVVVCDLRLPRGVGDLVHRRGPLRRVPGPAERDARRLEALPPDLARDVSRPSRQQRAALRPRPPLDEGPR